MIRLLIAGSRSVDPTVEDIDRALAGLLEGRTGDDLPDPAALAASVAEVVCGDADGGNRGGGARWGKARGVAVHHEPITEDEIRQLGKYVGPRMRNRRMAERATHALCFWDGKSELTADIVTRMVARKKPVEVIPMRPTRRGRRRG